MIRRDDGDDWLLIRQVDHADIAAEVAAVWGSPNVSRLPVPELLVPAIRHHDDGWLPWSRSPGIDPETGRPRNFTEMPMREATAIWSQSVDICGGRTCESTGPLGGSRRASAAGGVWVSRHFCWLAEQARDKRTEHSAGRAALDQFMADQQHIQRELGQRATAELPASRLDELLEAGFRWLQFFDELSLWLCCAKRQEAYEIESPAGTTIRLNPQSPTRVALTPYPLSVVELELDVPAKRLGVERFPDDAAFRSAYAGAPSERLTWQLCRN